MNEAQKTLTFVGVAVLAVALAWEPWARAAKGPADSAIGNRLFVDFKDALAATSLEVIQFDENTSTMKPFRVAKVNGVWAIPSHQNYPADARDHLAQAATSVIGVDVLGLASNNAGDHAEYGVVDPDMKTLKAGAKGVGTRVTFKDAKDKVLADLILGKAVKDQGGLRYVRKAGRDAVYRVSMKTDSLSTKFEDWIEKDLLKLNAFDIKQVQLNDYSSQTGITRTGQLAVGQLQRGKATLTYDDSKSAWNVVDLEVSKDKEKNKLEPAPLTEDEELNTEKLNNLKTALDDLKIVDVERKPKGLSDDLKVTEEFVKDAEAQESLFQRGFIPAMSREEKLEIISSEGEVICGLKDGVEYTLRFGRSTAGEGETANPDEEPKADDAKASRLNRYLFVTAKFNDALIPKPELEPLPSDEPAAKPADEKTEDAKKNDKPADETKPETKPAAETKPADKSAVETKSETTKPAASKAPATPPAKASNKPKDEEDEEEDAPADEPAKDAKDAKGEDAPKPAEAKTDEDKKDEAKKDKASKDEAKKAAEEKRAAVEKENKRKEDEYKEKLEKGKKHVDELNERFADWYYIISDDVYRKIHLSRADIVKMKEKKDEKKDDASKAEPGKGTDIGDFKELEKGLKK